MSNSKPRCSLEAYPRLTIRKTASELEQGLVAIFRTHYGSVVGEAFLIERVGSDLKIGFCFVAPHVTRGDGEDLLRVEEVEFSVSGLRRYFRCRRCKSRTTTLYFVDGWGCRKCHRLVYRRQRISPWLVRWEKRLALQELIGRGRPKYMRQAEYWELAEVLSDLRRSVPECPGVACEEHNLVVSARWLPVSQVPELAHSGFEIFNDVIRRRDPWVDTSDAPPEQTRSVPAEERPIKFDPDSFGGLDGGSSFFDR